MCLNYLGMNPNECLPLIPSKLRTAPWLKSIIGLFQEQARVIQEQTEQIATLKQTVQMPKDEIGRLTKTPKKPKFRPGGGDPKGRSGAPKDRPDNTSSIVDPKN